MSEERITLEEAMDYIDQYLTEKAPRGAYKKYLAMKDKELDDYYNRAKMMSKVADSVVDNKVKNEALRKRDESHDNMIKVDRDIRNKLLNHTNDDTAVDDLRKNARGEGSHISSDKLSVHTAKKSIGQGKDNMLSKLEKKPANTYLPKNIKESVDALKLRCYKSFEAGLITEEERDVYLDYLNLENYE